MNPILPPVPSVAGLRGYTRPPTTADLRLDANEVFYPELPPLVANIASSIRPGLYPDATPLEIALARIHGVSPSQVLVTAGSDDAIDRICRAFLGPGRAAAMTVPGFEMISRYVHLCGATLARIPWLRGTFPTDFFLKSITQVPSVGFVVSPCNPTGLALPFADITALADSAPNALLVHDAAYCEFADPEFQPKTSLPENLLILRTLSKAWGLAGLRVGYVIGSESIINPLRAAGQPYTVSSLSLAIAEQWLATGESIITHRAQTTSHWRDQLAAACTPLGEVVGPSQGNFIIVLANIPLAGLLIQYGIAVRTLKLPDSDQIATRITVPSSQADQDRLIASLQSIARTSGVLKS
jgi:histidinol-phosphate aminotransferase